MKHEVISSTYQVISFLLRYPTEEHRLAVADAQAFVADIGEPSVKKPLSAFLTTIAGWHQDQWVEHYIEVFDFGKTSNLYMTYLKLGEQKERGLELLKLKKFYESAGFEVTEKELPDYLPLMLEFCAKVSQEVRLELLAKHIAAIVETKNKLVTFESDYQFLLKAMIELVKIDGLEVQEEALTVKERSLSLEDVRIMQSMREQLINNQLG
ncbi:nitrate reductase molybdenum cofactor assembly chaperone [Gracilibacillus suaedae]|uniref:nitrate reductase molybdenum cofactor assembly chaperone n=1 Tax=Gracilibacillus suaedae TaxID=2820273 RepID=UPI001ABEAF55|nr:nitrate reductase molybdenum cofactor assembly chaperone [Gracilibacillus suaedae]